MKANEVASPTLPHFAGMTWRLEVPRASRASAAQPQGPAEGPMPVYSVRLSLAHMTPTPFAASSKDDNAAGSKSAAADDQEQQQKEESLVQARLEDVAFSCSPETLLALADAVEAAVKQSEQAPYRRILRLIR